jgi:hypothetical protein
MAASPEQKKSYTTVKTFRGLNTKANRTAIGEDEFAWIENLQPIGFGNIKVVGNYSNVSISGNAVTFSNNVNSFTTINLNNDDYILGFEDNGQAQYYNIDAGTFGNVSAVGKFSASGVRAKQWKNDRTMILDPNDGLYSWDGANLISVGSVGTIGITNGGTGYTSVPQVTISAPNEANGLQAQAIASISNAAGTITGIQVTNIGTGYTSVPLVTIDAPTSAFGVRAEAQATIQNGNVVVISVTNPGSAYTTTPNVTISGGGGSNATANAVLGSGLVNAITIIEAGTGYTSAPTVTISGGGGNNATAVAGLLTFKKGTVGIVLTNGGSGYTSPPNVTISGGGGTNAAATALVNGGVVTSVVVTNPGSGYTSNPTVSFSGGGGNGAAALAIATIDPNVDLATFQGRLWVAQGRTVFFSAAGTYNDFTSVSAGNINLADDTLHSTIDALISANNFLYVFGENSINVFSDVRVTSTGSTLFTNTNVSASVGSRRINTIFPYFRSLLFMNDYGIYALVGATTSKLSDALDGIFPLIDFTYPVSGGQVLINNILCAAFNFYFNDPNQGLRPVQAVFFDKKWFLTSQGTTKLTSSVATAGGVKLYATNGTNLALLYSDTLSDIPSRLETALWPMGDIIRTKQALKFGVEATLTLGGLINVTVDSETNSSPVYSLTNLVGWVNNSNQTITWENNSLVTVPWSYSNGYVLYKSDAQQYGKYLGLTVTSNSPGMTYNTFETEHELRVRF